MFDLHNNTALADLANNDSVTADTYSDYIDLTGYEAVEIIVSSTMATADASNYVTPKLYGANATPASFSSYTALADNDLNGAFTARNDTTEVAEKVGYAAGDNHYRYLCVFLDETGTASGTFTVQALLGRARNQPAHDDTLTTGAVS